MYVYYQIGILVGMIVVAFAIHILRQAINGSSPFIMFNYLLPYQFPLVEFLLLSLV